MDNFVKQPNEKFTFSINFSNTLDIDEIIDSYVVTAYLGDIDMTSTVIDSTTVDATTDIIRVRVKGGTTGNKYKITTLVTTDVGDIYEKDILMKVCEV